MFLSSFREARSSSLSFSQGNALWFTLGKSSELLRRLVDHRGTVADHATPVSSAAGVVSRRSSIQDRITKRLGSPYDSPLSTETAERSSRKSRARLHFGYVLDRALVSKGPRAVSDRNCRSPFSMCRNDNLRFRFRELRD